MQLEVSNLNKIEHLEKDILDTPVEVLDLPIRAYNVLKANNLNTIMDIITFGPNNIIKLRSAGVKTKKAISDAIKSIINNDSSSIVCNFDFNNSKDITPSKIKTPSTIEELIRNGFDEKLLYIPIEELNLSTRAFNALRKNNFKTVKDIINIDLHSLKRMKNVGRKTIDNIKDAILTLFSQPKLISKTSFIDAIEIILSSITQQYLPIIEARYGYDDGKSRTLEEIGNKEGITRERVRQITVQAIKQIKHNKKRGILQTLIESIEGLLLQYKGIISINDIAKEKYFISGTRNQLRFLMNLIVDIYEERYRIIDKYFLTSLSDYEIDLFHSEIRKAALECRFPINENDFIEHILSFVGPISKDYLSYYLLYKEHIEVLKDKVLSPERYSIPQRVKFLMKDINRPMHFTEIAKLYRNHFGDFKIKTKDLERAIHMRIGISKDFIIVDAGTFMLRNKFKVPINIKEIVKISKGILLRLKSISDTKYLVNELKKLRIDIGHLNAYSLKALLLEYPSFIGYGKFEIGIEDLADKYERKQFVDLIYEVLQSVSKPLHAKTIWKEISKQRGFPKYTVEQRLADDPGFIRIAPATYTIAKNISHYEENRKLIIDFAKEWINLKKSAISAFLIKEVLKETTEDKNLSLGLVEHVFNTSQEFMRLPNGFYDLSGKVNQDA